MFTTCLTCHRHLGWNSEVEAFPVGERLAFDPERGRLWVVCGTCGRWNLSPLEERWEAIDALERLFARSPLGAATDNVALARRPGGLEMIRIGRAQRPEIAAWRYGRRYLPASRGMAAGLSALGHARRLTDAVLEPVLHAVPRFRLRYDARTWIRIHGQPGRAIDAVPLPGGGRAVIRFRHLEGAELVRPERLEQWRLVIPHEAGRLELSSDLGLRVAGKLLAALNGVGWSGYHVEAAVRRLEEAGDRDSYFARVAALALRTSWGKNPDAPRGLPTLPAGASEMERLALQLTNRAFWARGAIGSEPRVALPRLAIADRLALEMAANEDRERRALAGELAELEAAWREAEEIAAIADGLFDERLAGRALRGLAPLLLRLRGAPTPA